MAKAILVCLSYTGNTQQIGEAVKKGMSPLLEKCDIVSLRQTDPQVLKEYDLIGIGSPVRLATLPAELKEFIAKINGLEGKHCFIFNTHAALPVNFMKHCVQSLKDKGLEVIGFKNWYCTVYLPYVPKPYFTDRHPDPIDLKEAEEFGQEMVKRSRRIKNGETELIQKLPEGKEYDEIYGGSMSLGGSLPVEVMQARAQGFKLDKEKCIRCNFCVALCPTHSINLSADQPFSKCDQCWLCEQTCPVGAISFNYPPLHKSHNVVVLKGFVPHLERAAAAGRFRPLVKDEEVGWETPLFKTHKQPRFKIVDEEYYKKKGQKEKQK